ncbi:hypothetical protein ABD72_18090 [Brevibacillus laterosporus]|nr:hypothetical protein [Brevibacillus laterosporus]TPH09913.1 hypothetical protein EGH09_21805 [Brevibacillus laterosporus]
MHAYLYYIIRNGFNHDQGRNRPLQGGEELGVNMLATDYKPSLLFKEHYKVPIFFWILHQTYDTTSQFQKL